MTELYSTKDKCYNFDDYLDVYSYLVVRMVESGLGSRELSLLEKIYHAAKNYAELSKEEGE